MDYASSLQFAWFGVHLIGVFIAFALRIYSGSRAELSLQALYLCGFAAVAAAALAGRHFCWPLGILSAATLAVMVVAAVFETGSRRDPHAARVARS